MAPWLIALTGVIYLVVAADLAWHGKQGLAIRICRVRGGQRRAVPGRQRMTMVREHAGSAAAQPSAASVGSHGWITGESGMSFGSAIADGHAELAIRALVFQLVIAFVAGAFGGWLLKSSGYPTDNITRDDIEILKDAAAAIGPGDPIARELWRLAERAEGK